MAEEQLGGMSSEESRRAYLRGENPGGLHHGGSGREAIKRGDEEDSTIPTVGETPMEESSASRH